MKFREILFAAVAGVAAYEIHRLVSFHVEPETCYWATSPDEEDEPVLSPDEEDEPVLSPDEEDTFDGIRSNFERSKGVDEWYDPDPLWPDGEGPGR
jgi:hypothetical protein